MSKNSIAGLLAIAVMASSLSGCGDVLEIADPNKFNLRCEGELAFTSRSEALGDRMYPSSREFSVDLEKMLWCFRENGRCVRIEEIISADLDRIVLSERELFESGFALELDRGNGRLSYDQDDQTNRLKGSLECRRRFFTPMKDNRKF